MCRKGRINFVREIKHLNMAVGFKGSRNDLSSRIEID